MVSVKVEVEDAEHCRNIKGIEKFIILRQSLASLADNFSAPYIGYYLASLTPSGAIQGVLQFSTNALPTLAQVLIGPYIDRFKKYVFVLFISSFIASFLWIFISLIQNPLTLTTLVTLRAVLVGVAGLSFTSLIGVVFKGSERGRVISNVNAVSQLMALITFVIIAMLINPSIDTLRMLFVFSGVLSTIASVFWIRMFFLDKCISREGELSNLGLAKVLSIVIRNRYFVKFSLIFSAHMMVVAFAWPLFPLMQRYVFKMSVSEIAILNIYGTASQIVFQLIVTKYVHRLKIKKMLVISRVGILTYTLSYALATNTIHIYIANAILGPFIALSNVLIPLYVFQTSTYGMYASYLATLNFMQGIASALGSIIGGTVVDRFIMNNDFNSIKLLMLLISIFRGLTALLLLKIRD